MTRRYLLTLFSAMLVMGCYSVYAQMVKQLLKRPDRTSLISQLPVAGSVQEIGPRSSHQAALKYLPDAPWAINARVKIHADGLHLFFNERIQENGKTEMRVSPVAIVWEAKSSQKDSQASEERSEPMTILAESATFVFDQPVELSDIRSEMLQDMMLRGDVKIRGANGLHVAGKNFVFSRANQHLRSDYPVQFKMGKSIGSAKNIQLNLEMLDGPSNHNNPQILGISDVLITGHMEINLVPERDELPVLIQSEKLFHFDIKKQLATFEEDVFVFRTDRQGYVDSIDCDKLQLQFANSKAEKTQSPKANSVAKTNLKVQSIHATGSPVICKSNGNNLLAQGEQLHYDIEKKIVVIDDTTVVDIDYLDTKLKTPRLEIHLDEKSYPTFAYCDGPGQLKHLKKKSDLDDIQTGKKSDVLADAFWSDSLTFAPEKRAAPGAKNLHVITLTGEAMIRSPTQSMGMIADTLRLWLEMKEKDSSTNDHDSSIEQSTKQWEMHKAIAKGKVAIASSYVEGKYETLTLNFEEKPEQVLAEILQKSSDQKEPGDNPEIQQVSDQQRERHSHLGRLNLHIDSKHLVLNVLHNDEFSKYHVSQIQTKGDVVATGKLTDSEETFRISGQGVEIENIAKNQQQFHLLGTPERFASIQNGNLRIDGIKLFMDTATNTAEVHKKGSLQIPVKTDWEGNQLDELQLLEVSWTEQMKFEGRRVHFVGGVRAVIQDSVITCEQLWVTLDQPVSFHAPKKQLKPQIAEIECTDGVHLKMNRIEQGKLIMVSDINVATFKINHLSGEMSAQGPGVIDFWQRNNGKSSFGFSEPTISKKKTDRDAENGSSKKEWNYTKLIFSGQMAGNLHQQKAKLNDRVNVLHGPVKKPLVKFTRDDRPAGSAWMRCQQLEILARKVNQKENPNIKTSLAIELQAKKNAEIEGDRFLVRADLISFDQLRNLFVMRAIENRHVTMWHYENEQAPRSRYDVKMILISPDGNILKLDRTLGASGSP